ncbi:MAG: mechanosensitive ion channel [Eubacteriales bacterium]|nr:mechanosensitive ion channel [Eubacteriales bacterium]
MILGVATGVEAWQRALPSVLTGFLHYTLWEGTSSLDLLLSLGLLILAWFLRRLPARLFLSLLKGEYKLQAQLRENLPPAYLLPLLSWVALKHWLLDFPPALSLLLDQVNAALLIVVLVRVGLACLHSLMQVELLSQDKWRARKGSLIFYFRLAQVLIWLIALLAILSLFGVNVASLAAGLGLGGLAISLAAQDSLSNLIAGFVLLNDPDLQVGDEIEILNYSGNLVDLGLRSSQIRAYDRSLVTLPNKLLTENALLNISRMDKRRVLFKLRLPLSAHQEDLLVLQREVKQYLQGRKDVDPTDIFCNLDGIQDTGIDLYVRFFVLDPSWSLMMEEKRLFLEFLWDLLLSRNLAEPKRGLRIEFAGSELWGKPDELISQLSQAGQVPSPTKR